MTKQKIAILGCTGMLGSMTLEVLVKDSNFEIIATYRDPYGIKRLVNKYPQVTFCGFDVEKTTLKGISKVIDSANWVINAIGVIKPYIHDDNAHEVRRALYINAQFPYLLAQAANRSRAKVIQIATDCVYSGQKGYYVETDPHDGLDAYGKTKSLGEVYAENVYHLRCSIIGPELKAHNSLLDWFLSNPRGAEVNGFTNHYWNGLTTLHFAKICCGIINNDLKLSHLQHIIPANELSKAALLKSMAKQYLREDITIKAVEVPVSINRTLSTVDEKINSELWRSAGYTSAPTIEEMIEELAQR